MYLLITRLKFRQGTNPQGLQGALDTPEATQQLINLLQQLLQLLSGSNGGIGGGAGATGTNGTAGAVNDSASTPPNTPTSIDVLANDPQLSVTNVTQPQNGTVTQDGNNLVYTPNPGFTGNDTFSYTKSTGASADVNIHVCGPEGGANSATGTNGTADATVAAGAAGATGATAAAPGTAAGNGNGGNAVNGTAPAPAPAPAEEKKHERLTPVWQYEWSVQ